jgi:Ca2+-binding RTX toxin-like protein
MAILDARLSVLDFNSYTGYSASIVQDPLSFTWDTAEGNRITAIGSGFTYAGNLPTAGTVTSINLDFTSATEPPGVIDAVITGLSVNATDLVSAADPAAGDRHFWETVLGGNDTIYAPRAADGLLFGDFSAVQGVLFVSTNKTGGNDTLTGDATAFVGGIGLGIGGRATPRALVGDAATVDGVESGLIAYFGNLTGGNDTFRLINKSNFTLIGDAATVGALGQVYGGKDDLRSDVSVVTAIGGYVQAGDVYQNNGYVTGGNDTLMGTNFAFTKEGLAGDAYISANSTQGGADMIQGRAGQEFISGDVMFAHAGNVNGGADTVRGGEDSDIIAGDVFDSSGTTATPVFTLKGGADRLYGDNGNDWITGDIWQATNAGATSYIEGGNDFLYGGAGDDQLFGEIDAAFASLLDVGGNDWLDGGLGNDIIDGQFGVDTAAFNTEAIGVLADILLGIASGQGSDTLAGIENLVGSIKIDSLRGDNDANRLTGNDGDDQLFGRGGVDFLIGGNGNDLLNGGAGADTMMGGAGVDTFVEGPLVGGPVTTDRITDFQNGVDKINLKAFGFANFASVLALSSNAGTNLKIDVPGSEILIVTGLTLATFDASDVILV